MLRMVGRLRVVGALCLGKKRWIIVTLPFPTVIFAVARIGFISWSTKRWCRSCALGTQTIAQAVPKELVERMCRF
jgi:hypothetical protein